MSQLMSWQLSWFCILSPANFTFKVMAIHFLFAIVFNVDSAFLKFSKICVFLKKRFQHSPSCLFRCAFTSASVANFLLQFLVGHHLLRTTNGVLPGWWPFIWFCSWNIRTNPLLHSLQLNGYSPEVMLEVRSNCQPNNLPVWIDLWCLRFTALRNDLLHISHSWGRSSVFLSVFT